jgi:hypothetical protein
MKGLLNLPALVDIDDDPPEAAPRSALEYLQSVYRDPTQSEAQRVRCAMAALPFESPKLAVIANFDPDGFAKRMEEIMERRGLRAVLDSKPIVATETSRKTDEG